MIAPLRKQSVQRPSLLADVTVVERMWRAALAPGQKLPQYEDVVLGSLGRLADHLLLFECDAHCFFRVLRAGRKISEWTGTNVRGNALADLPRDCAIALGAVLTQAIEASAPVPYRMHRVADGMVETYEMLAFPMACRWGPPIIGVYVAEAGTRYNLVDTIFRSTHEGILALAAIRNAAGAADRFSNRRLQPRRRRDAWRRREKICSGAGFPSCRSGRLRSAFAIVSLPALARDNSISSSSPLRERTVKSM